MAAAAAATAGAAILAAQTASPLDFAGPPKDDGINPLFTVDCYIPSYTVKCIKYI